MVVAPTGSTLTPVPTAAAAENKRQPSIRHFHATRKQEILPVLAAAAVFVVGRYSWKALNRMDEEWEDYQWQLQQYERFKRQNEENSDGSITIGVDLGTVYLKLAAMSGAKPELVPTAQGDRYRFSGVIWNKGNQDGNTTNEEDSIFVMGRPALDKFFYAPNASSASVQEQVVLPYRKMQESAHDDDTASIFQKVISSSVTEAAERMSSTSGPDIKKNIRTVLTLPTVFFKDNKEPMFHQSHHDDSQQTITVPDPVSAIWGAQSLRLLPTPTSKEEASTATLVVDVGGLATSISLVRQDKVLGTSYLHNVGGETFVQQLLQRVLDETGDVSLGQDAMTLALIQTSARSSALELVHKLETKVHIPYLFMGRRTDDPHFEMALSRTALNQIVQAYWAEAIVPKLIDEGQLSAALPPPTNASTLITSAVTKVLEESGELPTNIEHILLVGGGAKHKLFEQACTDGMWALMGPNPQKLVLPDPSLRAELTALGAASLLPNYDYSYDRGLERL